MVEPWERDKICNGTVEPLLKAQADSGFVGPKVHVIATVQEVLSEVRVKTVMVLLDCLTFAIFTEAYDHLNTLLELSHGLGEALKHKRP